MKKEEYIYTNEQLKEAVATSYSYAETLRILGANQHNRHLKERIKRLQYDTGHWQSNRATFTKEKLETVVPKVTTYADVARAFGVKPLGGTLVAIRKAIQKFDIDNSHFIGQAYNKGKKAHNKASAKDILVLRSPDRVRESGKRLTRALLEIGRKYKCEIEGCSITNEWNGKLLTLRVDHINGEYWDCCEDNVRFVCPNCDSQLDTYCAKNRK